MKRFVLLALCAALLLSAVGCSDSGTNETTADTSVTQTEDTTPVETEFNWKNGLDVQDYGGYTFTMLNGNVATWYSYTLNVPEESTGEPVNDAFYERNMRVNELYNVEITESVVSDSMADLRNAVKAGSNDFDMALVTLMNSYAVAMENNIYDLNTIDTFDFSHVWWDQNAVEDLTINNKLYFVTGSADTTRLDSIRALFFNQDMIREHDLEDPYTLVDEGKWTMDKFAELCRSVVADVDGDGEMTDTDRYGWISYTAIMTDLLINGMDNRYMYVDSETGRVANGTLSEGFYDAFSKIYDLVNSPDNAVFDIRASKHSGHLRGLGDRIQEQIFVENGALFYSECLAWSRVMREMEADFGIVPPPKLNEEQDRHYSIILNPFMEMIPVTAEDVNRTATILEAYNAASHDTVVPAYVDITLSGKVARDTDTVRMLNLVFEELAYNLHFTTIGTLRSTAESVVSSGKDNNLISKLEAQEKSVNTALDKINAFFFDE